MSFKICDRIKLPYREVGPMNICISGDSVSHGCFGGVEPHYDHDAVYHNRLKNMIFEEYPNAMVNIINTAVGGICAIDALPSFERDVVRHSPELVIICFGLNDVNYDFGDYVSSLEKMFRICRKNELDVIFMTPNMLNTYVAPDTPTEYIDYAHKTAEMQNGGRMDEYMNAAKALCERLGVPVCDCYGEWKRLSESGEDTTALLCNRINHPRRAMHALFAEKLFELIFGEGNGAARRAEDGMTELAK